MRVITFSIVATSALLLAGCQKGDFSVSPTSGRVTCNGQPVAGLRVFFEPLETGGTAIVGKQGRGVTEADGRFVVSTYASNDGAVVGRHRIRVGWADESDSSAATCPCTVNSEMDVMEVHVTSGDENEFQVLLLNKVRRQAPSLDDLEALEEAKAEAAED